MKKFTWKLSDIVILNRRKTKSFKQFIKEEGIEYFKQDGKTVHWVTIEGKHVLVDKDGNQLDKNGKVIKNPSVGLENDDNEVSENCVYGPNIITEAPSFSCDDDEINSGDFLNDYHGKFDMDGNEGDNIVKALKHYTYEGYNDINGYLRYPDDEDFIPTEYTKNAIELIDRAFNKAKPLKHDIICYRGVNANPYGELYKGSMFQDNGYVSTSADFNTANDNFRFNNDTSYMFKIRIPKGSKAISLENITANTEEYEILLPRGTKFKVNHIDPHQRLVECDVIGDNIHTEEKQPSNRDKAISDYMEKMNDFKDTEDDLKKLLENNGNITMSVYNNGFYDFKDGRVAPDVIRANMSYDNGNVRVKLKSKDRSNNIFESEFLSSLRDIKEAIRTAFKSNRNSEGNRIFSSRGKSNKETNDDILTRNTVSILR